MRVCKFESACRSCECLAALRKLKLVTVSVLLVLPGVRLRVEAAARDLRTSENQP